jgi:hypothetical protein
LCGLAVPTVLVLTLGLAGCGGTNPANVVHVSGTVTLDGKPIPLGMIVFEPDPSRGNSGPQGHADIKDGRFDTRASKKGAVVGPQLVRITGGDGVNPEPFTPFGKLLFDEHTVRVELSKEQATLQLDVPGPRSKKKGR